MVPDIEKLSVRRRKMLLGFTFGFGFSLIFVFINSLSAKIIVINDYKSVLIIAALLGWGFWAFHLIKILNLQKKVSKDPRIAAAFNDEFIQHLRQMSYTIAFWILLVFQAVLYVTNMVYALTVQFVILANIFVAVLAAAISFIILDRD